MNKYHEDNKTNGSRALQLKEHRQSLIARSVALTQEEKSLDNHKYPKDGYLFHTRLIGFATDNFLLHAQETHWQIERLQEIVAKQQAQIDELNSRFAIEMDNEAITPTDGKGNDIG